MKPKKKQEAIISTIRFASDTQLRLVDEVKQLSDECGVGYSDLVRNLIAIGLEAYKAGAVVGFDGRVILPFSTNHPSIIRNDEEIEGGVAPSETNAANNMSLTKKKSLFVE